MKIERGKMKQVRVKCHCCQGAGTISLTGYYLETYQTVRLICKKKTEFVVAGRDCERFGCNATALNNRLAALEKHGLLYSERWGRERRFFLCSVSGLIGESCSRHSSINRDGEVVMDAAEVLVRFKKEMARLRKTMRGSAIGGAMFSQGIEHGTMMASRSLKKILADLEKAKESGTRNEAGSGRESETRGA